MATNAATTAQTQNEDYLNSALPGFSNMTGNATGFIGDLLKGTPSPSTARMAANTFGLQNGLGQGSGLTSNYGYNLYNKQGQQNQQVGMQDLLSMLGGYSGTVAPTVGQTQQNDQFNASLENNQSQFQQTEQDRQNQMLMQIFGQLNQGN
jgi:hypothetical protein